MNKTVKVVSALVLIAFLNVPMSLYATALVDCINNADASFNACMKVAAVKGIIGGVIGGFVGLLGGPVGVGIGGSAGFLSGAAGASYGCEEDYIRQTDYCYATYPLVLM